MKIEGKRNILYAEDIKTICKNSLLTFKKK